MSTSSPTTNPPLSSTAFQVRPKSLRSIRVVALAPLKERVAKAPADAFGLTHPERRPRGGFDVNLQLLMKLLKLKLKKKIMMMMRQLSKPELETDRKIAFHFHRTCRRDIHR